MYLRIRTVLDPAPRKTRWVQLDCWMFDPAISIPSCSLVSQKYKISTNVSLRPNSSIFSVAILYHRKPLSGFLLILVILKFVIESINVIIRRFGILGYIRFLLDYFLVDLKYVWVLSFASRFETTRKRIFEKPSNSRGLMKSTHCHLQTFLQMQKYIWPRWYS